MSKYIVFRTIAGEQVVAELLDDIAENEVFRIKIKNPFQIVASSISTEDGRIIDYLVGKPYCDISGTEEYYILKTQIIFITSLHERYVNYYLALIKKFALPIIPPTKVPLEIKDDSNQTSVALEEPIVLDGVNYCSEDLENFLKTLKTDIDPDILEP